MSHINEAKEEGSTLAVLDSLGEVFIEISAHFALEEKEMLDEEELGERLKNWFVNHFSTKDARLHKFLDH